ncbi:uncharacterized protein FIBRA_03394 [Fibroporia radiculosa]|uniref:F-box domain-containing protein n=1 Tax=Fibroporia radiculosa TaxID=599839 RepID=J4H2D7_9APHY|nr:uncharacterized protein FIBRA_03394 [Fibroporia radiculosa]CCM01344.1 predicted protein [Fibroporia radiculosa]
MATRLSTGKARNASSAAHKGRGRKAPSVDTNPLSYDRTDPFTALNVLRTLLASLPSRIGGCQFRLSAEEHRLSMHLLTIVEPFVGLEPSRRTLERQPTEILDAIVFHLDSKRDLLALALSCRRLHTIIFPRHYDYRDVRCKVSSLSVWNHLIVHRALARNVRRLEILDERSTEALSVPSDILVSETDLESTDDELAMHTKQERYLVSALSRMSALHSFVWSCNHSPISIDNIWPILLRCQTLKQVGINDNLIFTPVALAGPDSGRKRQLIMPALKMISLQSTKHAYGASKNPDMSRISSMLTNCPILESLDIGYTPRRNPGFFNPVMDDFLLCGRWPHLRSLSLSNLWCSPHAGFDATATFLFAHSQLETLHLDISFGAGAPGGAAPRRPFMLPPNSLPRLRELRASKEIANAVLECPCDAPGGRPLETIKGVRLSGSTWDQVFFANLRIFGASLKRLELAGWNEMDDIKRLVECVPQLAWLDIGKRAGSGVTNAVLQAHTSKPAPLITTNFVEWAALLANMSNLATFHGARFFYEVASTSTAAVPLSISDRSRVRKNDEVASMLAWKCPKLRRLDHWEEGSGKVIVLLRDGDKHLDRRYMSEFPLSIAPQDDGSGVVPAPTEAPEPAPITDNEVGEYREQDRFLPIANVSRIMKSAVPGTAKISREAKECVQECVSEFISFITSEAAEKCQLEKRKTIGGEDILYAMVTLGFENYAETLKIHLAKLRQVGISIPVSSFVPPSSIDVLANSTKLLETTSVPETEGTSQLRSHKTCGHRTVTSTRPGAHTLAAILSSFDARLVKLEKSILPLYTSTQQLTRRARNIESALMKIDEIASYQEGIAAEEALILRGRFYSPQPGQLEEYMEVLQRMNATIAFGNLDGSVRDTARIIETGAKKLIQLYTKQVAEASSGSPINGPDFEPMPFPSATLDALRPLVEFLRTLPLPPTHPSHPAAPAIQAALKEAQKGYGDMRGSWLRKCLEIYGKRVAERAGTIDGVSAGREFGTFLENILNVAEEEYGLLAVLVPLPSAANIASTYNTLITPLVSLFSSTLSSLSTQVKRSLHKYTLLALSLFSCLTSHQTQWDEVMCRPGNRNENELKEGLQGIRATCQRSFPEFLADIKIAASSNRGELSTGVMDVTQTTVEYLERLPEIREAVIAVLQTLGDGNWKMGEGAQVGKSGRSTETDNQRILEHFVYDVISMILGTLQTMSRSNRRPAFGSIFLLNNVSYLLSHLLLRPKSPEIPALLSKPAQDMLQSNFRTAKAAYFDSNFSPLLQTLADDKDKSKSATKEKFTRFFDLFDEVTERHQLARVLHEDDEGRNTVSEEAVKLVVPSLQRFIQRNLGKDFSKNPKKYIKMSADEVESLIKMFYLETNSAVLPPAEQATNNLLIQAGWSR